MPRKNFVIKVTHAQLDCLNTAIGAINDDHRAALAGKKTDFSPPKGFWEKISWGPAQAIEKKLRRMMDKAGLAPLWRKEQQTVDAEWMEFFKAKGIDISENPRARRERKK